MTTTRKNERIGRACAAVIGALAAMVGGASSAWAEPPSFDERHADIVARHDKDKKETPKESDARTKRAREEFKAGNAALAAGDYKACEEHFAIVWVLTGGHSPNVAANLGLCENRLGFYLDAFEHLTKAKNDFDAAASSGERAVELGKTHEELAITEAHICPLGISGVPAGAVVTVGSKIRLIAKGAEKLTVNLYPGDYVLEVRVDGDLLHREPLHMVPSIGYSYVFVPPAPKQVAPLPVADAEPSMPLMLAGGVSAALFASFGAGMIGASQTKLSFASTLRTEIGGIFGSQVGACHAPTGTLVDLCRTLDATTDDAAIFEDLGIAALLTSGAIAGATLAYGWWPRSTGPAGPAATKPAPAATLTGRFVAGPGVAGVLISGTW